MRRGRISDLQKEGGHCHERTALSGKKEKFLGCRWVLDKKPEHPCFPSACGWVAGRWDDTWLPGRQRRAVPAQGAELLGLWARAPTLSYPTTLPGPNPRTP